MALYRNLIPENESERLAALKSYQVLDTLPEPDYDAITRLASYICGTPIALVSLMDSSRQWFKSKVGLDVAEMPRADAFCRYTILSDDILEVPDTLESELFANSEFVTGEPRVRFYAGAPLIDDQGFRLGSLCVIDSVPHKLTPQQRDALRTLAHEVISHLSLRKQKKELEESLKKHTEFFNLFNNSPEIHCVMDRRSNIELINNSVTAILGYTPQESIGKPIWFFFPEDDRERLLKVVEDSLRNKQKTFELETRVIARNGDIRWISWSVVAMGQNWYASGRDITYQKKILADLELMSLVASKVRNGVVISDAYRGIIWTNDAFTDITGFTYGEVKAGGLINSLTGEHTDLATINEMRNLIQRRRSFERDLQIYRKDGTPLWVSVNNSIIFDDHGNVDKYVEVLVDITKRKSAELDKEILSFASQKSPSGILIRDGQGKVIWMNESLEHSLGYTLNEMQGRAFGALLIGEDTDMAVFQEAVQATAEKRPYEIEIKIYKKDQSPIWVLLSNNPMIDEAGNVVRQTSVIIDITKRKEAEEKLTTLSLVASSTTTGVVINDKEGCVEWVNDAFEKITGYDLSSVYQRHIGDVLTGELTDVALIEKARELSRNKQSYELDLLIYRNDGQPIWVSVINSVIFDGKGEVSKYVEVLIDITEKKKAELQLIQAKEEAVQLNTAKDMFISVMSHEIRTPLNAVIGISNLLIEDHPDASQLENLKVLKFSADNLMTLINDVLDFTKVETGNVELEKADLNIRELVGSVVNSLQYKAQDKHIYIRADIDESLPAHILGDKTRICQILLNLAGNAVKFTDKGGVTIDLKVIEQTAGQVRIRFEVADTGIGIPPDKINTVFESFKQAQTNTTRLYGGTGLGLAISKRLVELHESRINVESIYGHSSKFWFTVTFDKGRNILDNNTVELKIGLKLNVLVVDDNHINRLLIDKVMKKWGINADFAENGLIAINKIESNHNYDVVLMDIHMPQMGGIEATKILRTMEDPYCRQLPIIALTASVLNDQMDMIGESGMNDYILKPFDQKVLYDKISKYSKE